MPQWPEDDNPSHTQQLAYEQDRERGGKFAAEWAQEWGVSKRHAFHLIYRLVQNRKMKLLGRYCVRRGKLQRLYLLLEPVRTELQWPRNIFTRYAYADICGISLKAADAQIDRRLQKGTVEQIGNFPGKFQWGGIVKMYRFKSPQLFNRKRSNLKGKKS